MKTDTNYINANDKKLRIYYLKRADKKYAYGFIWGYEGEKPYGFRILIDNFSSFIEVQA
jgi:hypothetical protein